MSRKERQKQEQRYKEICKTELCCKATQKQIRLHKKAAKKWEAKSKLRRMRKAP